MKVSSAAVFQDLLTFLLGSFIAAIERAFRPRLLASAAHESCANAGRFMPFPFLLSRRVRYAYEHNLTSGIIAWNLCGVFNCQLVRADNRANATAKILPVIG